jgi:hypothetical protein
VYSSGDGSVSAMIDPTFSAPGQSGYFIYSDGVTQGGSSVPEPGTFAPLTLGVMGLFGLRMRRGRTPGVEPPIDSPVPPAMLPPTERRGEDARNGSTTGFARG